jgi:hypothetical protein
LSAENEKRAHPKCARINEQDILDLLQNLIRLLKLLFLASLSTNFSTICLHIISKFVDKPAQKSSIFPAKAGFARGLLSLTYHWINLL